MGIVFIETSIFTKEIVKLIPDGSYRLLQRELFSRPGAGDLIRESGGLRKIRWKRPGSGKSGGIRVIYYFDKANDTIYMLLPYKKNDQENLTPQQLKYLRNIMREWLL